MELYYARNLISKRFYPFHMVTMSVPYYKHKLSCCNVTIYNMATKEGICYVWDESVAKRGANEVSGCLYEFIKDFSGKGVRDFRFWSDNCGGQNKKRIIFSLHTQQGSLRSL